MQDNLDVLPKVDASLAHAIATLRRCWTLFEAGGTKANTIPFESRAIEIVIDLSCKCVGLQLAEHDR